MGIVSKPTGALLLLSFLQTGRFAAIVAGDELELVGQEKEQEGYLLLLQREKEQAEKIKAERLAREKAEMEEQLRQEQAEAVRQAVEKANAQQATVEEGRRRRQEKRLAALLEEDIESMLAHSLLVHIRRSK